MNKQTVVIQGLGFVGAVMALVVANSEDDLYNVIGVDLPSNKVVIDKLNAGEFPIQSSDSKVYTYFEKAKERRNFFATSDASVYTQADIVVVDINLDVRKGIYDALKNNYSVNLDGFKAAMRSIASVCKQDLLVLVETTVPPGTCTKIVKPIFEEEFNKRGLSFDFKIGHSYERVMPGPGYVDSIKNFYRVYSGIDDRSANAVEDFLRTIISTKEYPLTRLSNTNATEMAKVLENSFRAMNIAFIQEWTEFAEVADVNLFEVIDAIRMRPTHRNIMRPGLGVGGYCLTKDPLLASWSSQHLFGSNRLQQSEKAVEINDEMPRHTLRLVLHYFNKQVEGKRILFLGVSYLQDVGDTRFTPIEKVYSDLLSRQANITLHDPYVSFWEEYEVEISGDGDVLSREYDALILGTPHAEYFKKEGILGQILGQNKPFVVFDPHGVISVDIRNSFNQHSYKIIGRGDDV